MRIAERICLYLMGHDATRPEMAKALGVNEKSLESAIRKLLALRYVIDTKKRRQEIGIRAAIIYSLGSVPFSAKAFSRGVGAAAQQKKVEIIAAERQETDLREQAIPILERAMHAMCSVRDSECLS